MKEQLKGFGSMIVGTAIGIAAIDMLGNAGSSLGKGIKDSSQTLVAGFVLGNIFSNGKGMFKFK